MRRITTFIIAACGAAALSGAASADILDRFQFKLGVSGVLPEESADISTIGGDVDISDEYVPTLAIEYFLTDNISAELLCCMARHDVKAVGTALGDVDLGQISHFPPTVTVKYRWTGFGQFQPYVGAGANFTAFFDEDAGAVSSISYDDSFGPAVQIGADYRLSDHWSLNLDVRRIWISSDVTIRAGATTINADVDINPYVITVGTGYRF